MEEVKTDKTFKIASYIALYWMPILTPVGLTGNILSFLVMIKSNNRKMSTCICMAAISINDNVMMVIQLYSWLTVVAKWHGPDTIACKLAAYLVVLAMQNGTFLVFAMTFDKYIAIKWPHKAAIYSTPRRAKIIITGVCICVDVYNTLIYLLQNFLAAIVQLVQLVAQLPRFILGCHLS